MFTAGFVIQNDTNSHKHIKGIKVRESLENIFTGFQQKSQSQSKSVNHEKMALALLPLPKIHSLLFSFGCFVDFQFHLHPYNKN
jgi:hypothetical protein